MLRSSLNCLRRVRFGTARWWADVGRMQTGAWRAQDSNAATPALEPGQTAAPTRKQLDKIASLARKAQSAGVPQNVMRGTWTVAREATAAEVHAMRAAILRGNYFPTREDVPAPRTPSSAADDRGSDATDAGGRQSGWLDAVLGAHAARGASALLVPAHGSWSDRAQTITTLSGTASMPAEAEVGDHLLLQAQLAPGVPLLDRLSMVCVDKVTHKYDEDGAAGFTVATTAVHDEVGSHTAVLRWSRVDDDGGDVSSVNGAQGESLLPGATDPIRDTVRFLRQVVSGDGGDGDADDGARYLVKLDVAAATGFQPHVSLNPLAVAYARFLARRSHELSVDHLRAVGLAGCALRDDPRTAHGPAAAATTTAPTMVSAQQRQKKQKKSKDQRKPPSTGSGTDDELPLAFA